MQTAQVLIADRPQSAQLQPVERLAYTLTEARQAIGVGESTMRCLIASGALPAVRVGRRVLISKAAVLAFLDGPGHRDLSARDR